MSSKILIHALRWWLLGLIVLLPESIGYVWHQPLAISYLNILSVGFILLLALNVILRNLKLTKISSRSLTAVIILFALMLSWGTLFSSPIQSVLGPWTSRFLQPLIVGYGAYLMLSQGKIEKTNIYTALWLSLSLLTLHGLAQWLGIIETNNFGRLTGPHDFPNSFARILIFLQLVLLPDLITSSSDRKIFKALIWFGSVLVLLGTESYAGIASLIIGSIVILLLLPSQFKKLKSVTLLLIVVAIAGGVVFRQQLPKYQATTSTSLQTRQQFWHIAIETIKTKPITGIGLEGWERNYLTLARTYIHEPDEMIIETTSAQPHNIYLDGWLRGGIVGLLAVLWFLIWPVYYGVRHRRNIDSTVLGLAGLGIALVVFGLVDDPIFSDDAMAFLWLIYFVFLDKNVQNPAIVQKAHTS